MNEPVKILLDKYKAGVASLEEIQVIEGYIERGLLELNDFEDLIQMEQDLQKVTYPDPGLELNNRFYFMLAEEKRKQRRFSWASLNFTGSPVLARIALASVTFIAGLVAGYTLLPKPSPANSELASLKSEVTDLKEMMMLSLLEKESATDRLKAVSLTQEIDQVSKTVTDALLKTLNNDENANVRLAALDVLKAYAEDSNVRAALVQSIAYQESPLVQVALAEVMAQLQVKSSVSEFEKILKSENTPPDVKKKIRQSIDILI